MIQAFSNPSKESSGHESNITSRKPKEKTAARSWGVFLGMFVAVATVIVMFFYATHFPDNFPADPADRLIAATARAEGLPLVSRDARIRASAVVETIW